ncbi:mannose-specific lectin-like [Aristolochia californica]|uniref:mannose-specific lectin-like n=1 Tax=Aristolochia californica TaxID=171875 RepID=UPI0035E1F427
MARALLLVPALLLFFISPCFAVGNILYSGERLSAGQYLSYGEAYGFIMQEDCNLVLYEYNTPIWASNTGGLGRNCYCTLQADGNLVVYTPQGAPIWASNTGRNSGHYVLVLQKDRNVVIYGGAIWATGTNKGLEGITITTDEGLSTPSSS